MKILFVCSGNTCRSPMAEVLARELASDAGLTEVEFRSAGTGAARGFPASGGAQRTVARHGLDLARHASAPLTLELVDWATVILTMGTAHLDRVRELGGGEKSFLLGAYASGEEDGAGAGLAIPDPFGGDDRVYEETYQKLREYVELTLTRLADDEEGH